MQYDKAVANLANQVHREWRSVTWYFLMEEHNEQVCNLRSRYGIIRLIITKLKHKYVHIFIQQPMSLLVCNGNCMYSNGTALYGY